MATNDTDYKCHIKAIQFIIKSYMIHIMPLVINSMVVFLLECREDEERQAAFCRKEASSPLLELTASFTNGATLMEI